MRWRPTLVLLGIVLLALAYALLVERRVEPPPAESPLVFPAFAAARARVDRLELRRPRGAATETLVFELVREPSLARWYLVEPVRRRADADILGGLLRLLGELARVREDVALVPRAPAASDALDAPDASGDPAEYGLDPGQAVALRCLAGGEELLAGEVGRVVERPGGRLAYLRRPGAARASLVDARARTLLERPLTDYLSRELLPFPAATIGRLTVTPGLSPPAPGRPGAGLAPLELWPAAGGRYLVRARLSTLASTPGTDRVAPDRAERALALLASTHALSWLGPGGTPDAQASCGIGPEAPRLEVVELLAPGPALERRERTWTLRLGDWQDPLGRRAYLLVEGGGETPFIATAETRFLDVLALEQLRATHLAAFAASKVSRVELDFPPGSSGAGAPGRRVLQQGPAGWELLDGGRRPVPVPPDTVQRLLDAAARAEIRQRVPAEAALRERAPALGVRIYYGTETRPAEEFVLGLEAEKEIWAWHPELADEVLYRVDGDLARLFAQPAEAYGPLERASALDPETVVGLELRGPLPPGGGARPVFAVQRATEAAGGAWSPAPAASVPWRSADREHLRRLIALAARLRARTLLGSRPAAELADCGLDPPQYVVRLAVRPAAGAERTLELELGASAAGCEPYAAGLYYARLAGTDELFTVDQAWLGEVTHLLRAPAEGAPRSPLPTAPAPRP